LRSKFAIWSRTDAGTKRGSGFPSWSRCSNGALSASRISIFTMRPTQTRWFRTRFSRCSATSIHTAWPFEVWFTRILINGCLDRRKARARRSRWFVAAEANGADDAYAGAHRNAGTAFGASPALDPESRLLARERRVRLAAAIDRLDGRQRTIFMLSHYGDCTPREVGAMMGLKESTVRVHLFRAARKLRRVLGAKP
jgi:RNA polymerase sigma factor (sigma-70 family)